MEERTEGRGREILEIKRKQEKKSTKTKQEVKEWMCGNKGDEDKGRGAGRRY